MLKKTKKNGFFYTHSGIESVKFLADFVQLLMSKQETRGWI